MLEMKKLPKDAIEGVAVQKMEMPRIDMQYLYVMPRTSIKPHDHDGKQWEVWVWRATKRAYICLKGEEHELVNNSNMPMELAAYKGSQDYSYEELARFFYNFGYSIHRGSIYANP